MMVRLFKQLIIIVFSFFILSGKLFPTHRLNRIPQLKSHVKYLSSTDLEGRVPASRGDTLSREYIASHYSNIGLIPIIDGEYFQHFPILHRIEEHNSSEFNVISYSNDTTKYKFNIDYVGDHQSGSGTAHGEAVIIGYGIYAPDNNYNDYDKIDLRNKIVFCYLVTPKEIIQKNVRQFALASTYIEKTELAFSRGASAFIYIMPEGCTSLVPVAAYHNEIPAQHFQQLNKPVLRIKYKVFKDIISHSDFCLDNLERKLHCSLHSQAYHIPNISISLSYNIKYKYKAACNIIGMMKGRNSKETIIIGAHYDHMGYDNSGMLRLGANDNASGVAVMLELASLLSITNPECNYLFVAFGMEERGCIGSKYFIRNLPYKVNKIKAMINLDMVGQLRNNTLFLYHSQSATEWPAYISSANSPEMNIVFMSNRSPSDSDIFNKAGIPTLFIYTGPDNISNYTNEYLSLNYDGMERILNFAFGLIQRISNRDNKLTFRE